jgi:hypothetical protein
MQLSGLSCMGQVQRRGFRCRLKPTVTRLSCHGCPLWPAPVIGESAAVPNAAASVIRRRLLPSYGAPALLSPTNFWNSGSSCRQSRSESLEAQFRLTYPAATAFLNVSSASAFFPSTP